MSKTILIVDDEVALELVYKKLLEKLSFEVTFSDHPQKAWKEIDKKKFDLIITDLKMPVIEGDEFIKIVRQSKLNKETPVILCSGFIERKVMAELTRTSKTYFLNKPFDNKTLVEAVLKTLNIPMHNEDSSNDSLVVAEKFKSFLHASHIGKLNLEGITEHDVWNFDSILINFSLEYNQQKFNFNLLAQERTFLGIASKIQGTHYKELDEEAFLIWNSIIKKSLETSFGISYFKIKALEFIKFKKLSQMYKVQTEFGELIFFVKG